MTQSETNSSAGAGPLSPVCASSSSDAPGAGFSLSRALMLARACEDAYASPTLNSELAHGRVTPDPARGELVVAFRGTKSMRDVITDLNFKFTDYGTVKLHAGFSAAAFSIWVGLQPLATEATKAGWKIVIAGHSLGAAIGMLAAKTLHSAQMAPAEVYTFGGPRVGDQQWASLYGEALGDRTWRLVDEEDAVPRVPPAAIGYRHAGQEVFLSSFGGVSFGAPIWFKLASDVVGTWLDWKLGKIAQLADHGIAEYVARLEEETTTGAGGESDQLPAEVK